MTTYNRFEINTGYIFLDVSENWKKYNRNFLLRTFKEALENVLLREKIFTVKYSEESKDYFRNYREVRFERDLKNAGNEDNFPFPDYFLKYREENDEYPSIIYYHEPIVVNKDSNYFDLFFSLKLSVTDIFYADNFLNYHLESTFMNVFDEYKLFIQNISIKYRGFLKDSHGILINRFINQKMLGMIENENASNQKNIEHTLARQIMAIHYMLETLGMGSNIDKTEVARFAQFLTGRELNATNIRNTNIYKRVNNLLSTSERSADGDLQFVRQYFERLGISSISEKISKEINSKE